MATTQELSRRLSRLEIQLEKVRGKEYSLPFGSMARAKVSRKWDELAREKMNIKNELDFKLAMRDGDPF